MSQAWVKPYRDVINTQYKLDEAGKQEFDAYFARVEAFAATCSDQAAFTTQYTQSPLYQEYTQLMQKYQKQVVTPDGRTVGEATANAGKIKPGNMAAECAKSMARQEVNSAVRQVLPDEVNQLRGAGLRSIPVIGSIIQLLDSIKWFRNLFGRR